ncbi:DUF2092 domain-containing protein [Accumulibacter sp.]|uniref:DUF2092 domain-containing protein n=1 Tax=Accumulibacter sp. TaxID=2053492 RepID=UPI001DA19A8A|nr:DUF2092 domain-containing protein [Accumulibacter sp.]MCB1965236.1 DUF2092 domain-containing protein [Accumulibacter sp.]MCP5227787.1 DUF2092 domain-containing protein [Accumulibacter sp.]
MKPSAIGHFCGGTLLAAAVIFGGCAAAVAEEKPQPAAAPAAEVKDQRALTLLKGMSDKLASAKTVGFKVRSLVPMPAPNGQYISLFGTSRVLMQRPDKLFVESRGDLFPIDLYCDGQTVTAAVGPGNELYAQQAAPGSTIDAILEKEHPAADALAPFVDLLVSDPYARLAKDLSGAFLVGESTVGGVQTEHLAFTAKGVDWEIWIGTKDKLPRLVIVAYRSGERQPGFTVEFSDWKLDAPIPAQAFKVVLPKDATQLEFKLHGLPQSR